MTHNFNTVTAVVQVNWLLSNFSTQIFIISLQKEKFQTTTNEDISSKNKIVSQTPTTKISNPSTVSKYSEPELRANPDKNVSSQNPKSSSTKSSEEQKSNRAPDSAKRPDTVTNVCDQLVKDYLKRNGFQEVLNDFQSARKLQTRLESSESCNKNTESSLTLEKLFKFEKKKRKKLFETTGNGRSLDSWASIREGFSDLADHLNPEDPESEVDKMIKFILDANIPVRYFNVQYSYITHITNLYSLELMNIKKVCSHFKIGRFSRGAKGEDGVITTNWERLVKDANIQNPRKCYKDFKKLSRTKGTDRLSLRKRNVLGCYLAQNLPYIRHGSDVFQRAVAVLYPCNEGRYTKEEDELILEEVKKHGADCGTWRTLAELLNRKKAGNISVRHEVLTKGKTNNSGKWSSEDYRLFFDYIFKERNPGKEAGVDFINSIKNSVIMASGEVLNRIPCRVYSHWYGYVKPLLLSYHCGSLHTEWKFRFFDYLIKSKVASNQDINWEEAKAEFPNQSTNSLAASFRDVRRTESYNGVPLYLAIQDFKEKTKHHNVRQSSKDFKEKIVFLYDKARGVIDE